MSRTWRSPRRGGAAPGLAGDCLGDKTMSFGVISTGNPEPETPETVAARIRAALKHRRLSG